jgi:hypothetical protein
MNDTDAITLKHAADRYGFTVATLRAEAGRGRLTIYRIGKRLYTTPADIRSMVESCREEPKAPAFTVTRRGAVSSSYVTEYASLDSAQQALLKLRNASRNTLNPSTARTPQRVR